LVTKCVTGDFLQLTFNDVVRGGEGEGWSKSASHDMTQNDMI
jgi:hypothetical protein